MSAEVLNDHDRRLADVIRPGTVAAVDLVRARARVDLGAGTLTDWLPMPALRAGAGLRIWSPLSVGEQVLIAAPSGELGQAAILGSYYRTAHPAPSSDAQAVHLAFGDGAAISYHQGSHALAVTLPAGGTISIAAEGGVTINASGGDVIVTGDVIADGISLKSHVHGGVQAGAATTGAPV